MTDPPPPSTPSMPNTPTAGPRLPVRLMLIAYAALAAVGFPLAGLLTPSDLRTPALIAGGLVLVVALLGVGPLWLGGRSTDHATVINSLLGAVVLRLTLTAVAILGYLLTLPSDLRRPVGLLAIAWFAASWLIELGILIPSLRSRPQAAP